MAGVFNPAPLSDIGHVIQLAIAPVFLNVILIGVLVYAWQTGQDARYVGYALSWGVLAVTGLAVSPNRVVTTRCGPARSSLMPAW